MPVTETMPLELTGAYGVIHIRQAGIEQVDAVKEIAESTFKATFSAVNTPENMKQYLDSALSREKLLAELADENNFYFLVEKASQVVGYIKLQGQFDCADPSIPAIILEKRSMFLERFYLRQSAQGTGIAQAMMQFCFDFSRQMNRDALWLGVWEKNHRAQAFYARQGFERVGSHLFPLGNEVQRDHWMMRRL